MVIQRRSTKESIEIVYRRNVSTQNTFKNISYLVLEDKLISTLWSLLTKKAIGIDGIEYLQKYGK